MKKHEHKILIVAFILMLLIPTIVHVFGVEKTMLKAESNTIKSFPKLTINQPRLFTINLRNYYKNHFGLRNTLFEIYRDFMQNVLQEDPLPTKVINGKKGWLFLGDADSNVLAESLGYVNFSKTELQQLTQKIKSQKEWLARKNIQYYIAVAPNKHTIYLDELPLKKGSSKTKITTLKQYLKTKINFDLIDLKTYLIPQKDSIKLFYQHDTHWNDFGALLGYQKLIEELEKNNPTLSKQKIHSYDVEKDTIVYVVGDLNGMLNNGIKEKRIILKKKGKSNVVEAPKKLKIPYGYNRDSDIYEYRYKNTTKKLKILIFRDSFTQALRKYLNETFNECVYIWDYTFNKALIEKEKPDIVLYIVVERYIERINK